MISPLTSVFLIFELKSEKVNGGVINGHRRGETVELFTCQGLKLLK